MFIYDHNKLFYDLGYSEHLKLLVLFNIPIHTCDSLLAFTKHATSISNLDTVTCHSTSVKKDNALNLG